MRPPRCCTRRTLPGFNRWWQGSPGVGNAHAIIRRHTEKASSMAQRAVPSPSIDFRDRLLIDRHSSVLSRLSLRRQASLANPASADATIWNTFRTLAQMDPAVWIPELMGLGRLRSVQSPRDLRGGISLTLWKRVK